MILLVFKFVIESDSVIFEKITNRIITIVFLLSCSFYLPNNAYKEDREYEEFVDKVWNNFDENLLNKKIKEEKLVFLDISADWCLSCLINNEFVLKRSWTLDLLANEKVFAIRLDLTKHEKWVKAEEFFKKNHIYGIPFNIVYGPCAREGIKLPIFVTYEYIKRALAKASCQKEGN